MKKAIALLVAIATVCTLSVTALAQGVDGIAPYTEWAPGSTDDKPLVSVQANQLVIGLSADTVVPPETFLKPGTEYTYRIYKVDTGSTSVAPNAVKMSLLTENDLNGAKLRLRTAKGSGNAVTAKIEKKGSGGNAYYQFKIETKETYGTKVHELEYTLVASGGTSTFVDGSMTFETGYRSMDDDDIDSYDEGDVITIDDDYPVITKKQFETLAKNYNYKAVEFEGEDGDWYFTCRVSGMGDANFLTMYDVVPDIVNAYPELDYKFITFPAGITFPTNGELRLDVSDMDNPRDLHAYLYRNGTLTPIAHTYDGTADEIVFRTNYLGSFVVTDAEVEYTGNNGDDDGDDGDLDIDLGGDNNENPPTGASTTVNALAALGIASLFAGKAISRKRK